MTLAQSLKDNTSAVSFRKTAWRSKKRLKDEHRRSAEQLFRAEERSLSASKTLIDVKDPAYVLVVKTIRRARKYWQSMSIKFPADKKIRLIRKDLVPQFESQMVVFSQELEQAVAALCSEFNRLKLEAKKHLGDLYSSGDYPNIDDILEAFSIEWWYPSVEPVGDLRELHPRVYEAEQARVAARFAEAMATAEQALAANLQEFIGDLCDRLNPSSTGKKKGLTPSAIKGLTEFVAEFRATNISTNEELEALMTQAENLARGIDPSALKKNPEQQTELFGTMTALRESLDAMVVDAPTRKITLEDE